MSNRDDVPCIRDFSFNQFAISIAKTSLYLKYYYSTTYLDYHKVFAIEIAKLLKLKSLLQYETKNKHQHINQAEQ